MIRIFIADTGEALDLPKDLKLSIELTSPLFSEQGSVSLPVTLPATMRNKSLLQYVTMPQVMQSKATSFDVVVTTDYIPSWAAKMTVLSHTADTINVALLFRESEAYEKQDTQLSSVFGDDETLNFSPSVGYGTYNINGQRAMAIIPVSTDDPNVIINNHVSSSVNLDKSSRTMTIRDLQCVVPPYYAITPHLYLNYLLTRIFDYLGYSMTGNLFSNWYEAEGHVLVLNNNIDSLIGTGNGAKVYLRHLVPSCTIKEFLSAVGVQFGGAFNYKLDRTVSFVTFNEVLNSVNDSDISNKLTSAPSITMTESKHIALKSKKIDDPDAHQVELETVQDFERYAKRRTVDNVFDNTIIDLPSPGAATLKDTGIYRLICDNSFYVIYKVPAGQFTNRASLNNGGYGVSLPNSERKTFDVSISTNSNDYGSGQMSTTQFYQSGTVPSGQSSVSYSIWAKRLCHDNLDFIPDVDDDKQEVIEGNYSQVAMKAHYNSNNQLTHCYPCVGKYRQMTTDVVDADGNAIDQESECPIMFALADCCYPASFNTEFNSQADDYAKTVRFGSVTCNINRLPAPQGAIHINRGLADNYSLTFGGYGGVYKRLYQKYDMVLQKAWNDVNAPIHLSVGELINFDFTKKYILNGLPVVPLSLKIEITDTSCDIVESTFKTIHYD